MPGLYLPASFAIHDLEPSFICNLCGHPFYVGEDRAYERHVMAHSHEEVRSHSPRVQAPGLFDDEHEASGDVEWGRWIKRNHAERPEQWRKWMRTDDAG